MPQSQVCLNDYYISWRKTNGKREIFQNAYAAYLSYSYAAVSIYVFGDYARNQSTGQPCSTI